MQPKAENLARVFPSQSNDEAHSFQPEDCTQTLTCGILRERKKRRGETIHTWSSSFDFDTANLEDWWEGGEDASTGAAPLAERSGTTHSACYGDWSHDSFPWWGTGGGGSVLKQRRAWEASGPYQRRRCGARSVEWLCTTSSTSRIMQRASGRYPDRTVASIQGGPIWLPCVILIIGIEQGAKLEPTHSINLALAMLLRSLFPSKSCREGASCARGHSEVVLWSLEPT